MLRIANPEKDIPALIATHYAELKAFAHTTPGVQNASMEFDLETLAPTYHLILGLPGRSNAFAIAARLGLERALVERARENVGKSNAIGYGKLWAKMGYHAYDMVFICAKMKRSISAFGKPR